MTEETAIRIAEALESINGGIRVGIWLFACFAIVWYIFAIFKN